MTYYDEIAKGYNELYKEEQIRKLSIIADLDLISSNDKLLDVGCGTAFSLDYFDVSEAVGIDPAAKLVEQYKGNHQILVGAAEKMPFENNYFDIVISITAIQNFDEIKVGLEEIKRVGKDRFILTYLKKSPNSDEIETSLKEVFNDFEIMRKEGKKDIYFAITAKE